MRRIFCYSANTVSRVSSPNLQGKAPVQNAEVKDCFPECCVSPLTSCAVCKNISCNSWLMFRWRTRMLVEHRYFEWFILFTVLISSLVLVRFPFFLFFSKISFLVWHCGFVSVRSLVGNIALCSVSSQRKLEHNATENWSIMQQTIKNCIQVATNVRRQSPKFECYLSLPLYSCFGRRHCVVFFSHTI